MGALEMLFNVLETCVSHLFYDVFFVPKWPISKHFGVFLEPKTGYYRLTTSPQHWFRASQVVREPFWETPFLNPFFTHFWSPLSTVLWDLW